MTLCQTPSRMGGGYLLTIVLPCRLGTQRRLVLLRSWYPHFLDQSYAPAHSSTLCCTLYLYKLQRVYIPVLTVLYDSLDRSEFSVQIASSSACYTCTIKIDIAFIGLLLFVTPFIAVFSLMPVTRVTCKAVIRQLWYDFVNLICFCKPYFDVMLYRVLCLLCVLLCPKFPTSIKRGHYEMTVDVLSVCPSVCRVHRPNSTTERPMKPKNGWMEAYLEVKRSSFKVIRPTNAVTDNATYGDRREFPWRRVGESESLFH